MAILALGFPDQESQRTTLRKEFSYRLRSHGAGLGGDVRRAGTFLQPIRRAVWDQRQSGQSQRSDSIGWQSVRGLAFGGIPYPAHAANVWTDIVWQSGGGTRATSVSPSHGQPIATLRQ